MYDSVPTFTLCSLGCDISYSEFIITAMAAEAWVYRRLVHVGFLVDKVVLEQVFLQLFQLFPVIMLQTIH